MEDNKPKEDLPKSIEVEGGTVEEAIKRAIDFFNVSREEITVKVMCEGKKGLFGMEGAKLAKIKASLKKNKNNT